MLYPVFDELKALKAKVPRLSIASRQKVMSISGGDRHSPFRGQGLDFEEVRTYAPGDDIRAIDWRVTARTGVPHTKVFREDRERSVILCVDVNEAMRFGTRGTFKSIQAARVAALLGWHASLNHDKLGFCLFGDISSGIQFFAPQRSRKPLWEMFKKLCRERFEEEALSYSLEDMLTHLRGSVPTGALVYIISDFSQVGQPLEKQLTALRKRCDVVLIPLDDPADRFIPPLGPLIFSRQGKDKLYVDTESYKGREAYTAQWDMNRQTLETMAGKLRIPLIPIATNGDVAADLFLGLKRLKRKRM